MNYIGISDTQYEICLNQCTQGVWKSIKSVTDNMLPSIFDLFGIHTSHNLRKRHQPASKQASLTPHCAMQLSHRHDFTVRAIEPRFSTIGPQYIRPHYAPAIIPDTRNDKSRIERCSSAPSTSRLSDSEKTMTILFFCLSGISSLKTIVW